MKRTILGLGLVVGTVVVMGCGGATTDTTGGEAQQQVTKQQMNDVQQKLQEIKSEVLKVQMDDSLTKEQKAKKIEALQAEIRNVAK
jgi:uncharacterized membrane-anchored protein YhcB (DUF1043 family)